MIKYATGRVKNKLPFNCEMDFLCTVYQLISNYQIKIFKFDTIGMSHKVAVGLRDVYGQFCSWRAIVQKAFPDLYTRYYFKIASR